MVRDRVEKPHRQKQIPPKDPTCIHLSELDNAISRALEYLASKQDPDGSWPGDYGGPMFLLPIYVAVARAIDLKLSPDEQNEMIRYILNHQNDDGGWGLDIVSPSIVFTSVWNYIALRMLGLSGREAPLIKARKWILSKGGAVGSASWGKIALAIFNLYDYRGLHPIPPEFWLMPRTFPLHPGRYWCHNRMVYLPLAYLYGKRAQVPPDKLILQLRDEIYTEPYSQINWEKQRDRLAPTDQIVPHTPFLKFAHQLLARFETVHLKNLREKALQFILKQIDYEDKITNYICIGPVNKLFNTMVWFFANPRGEELKKHREKLPEYLYRARDGIKMNGYNSSRLWDTAFAVQAIMATDKFNDYRSCLTKAFHYIRDNQVLEDPPDHQYYFRDPARGGWPFSNLEHGWPISDCTSEGLKASILLRDKLGLSFDIQRLRWAVDLLLYFQNDDGGWATYERRRAPKWLEKLNPSDVFANIMVDYSYVECSSACIQALRSFLSLDPNYRQLEILRAIDKGKEFILSIQRDDGSWEGSWGICFTYGTWFGIWGLRSAGILPAHPSVEKAAQFLIRHQNSDGGWGEDPRSCLESRYISSTSQPIRTAWALLGLLETGYSKSTPVKRGIRFLIDSQLQNGDWPEETIAGIFNKTCAIHYDNYSKIFPLWALAKYRKKISESNF